MPSYLYKTWILTYCRLFANFQKVLLHFKRKSAEKTVVINVRVSTSCLYVSWRKDKTASVPHVQLLDFFFESQSQVGKRVQSNKCLEKWKT